MIAFDAPFSSRLAHRHATGDDALVAIKRATILTPSVDRKNRLVQGVVSCESVDVDGDVIVQSGIDTSYFFGPEGTELGAKTVYLDHDYSKPIGTCVNLSIRNGEMFSTTFITKLPVGEDVLTLVEEGIIRGLSIGFRILEANAPTAVEVAQYGANCQRVIRKSLMLEYSLTPMPCNPDAMLAVASLVKSQKVKPQTLDWLNRLSPQVEAKKQAPTVFVLDGEVVTVE